MPQLSVLLRHRLEHDPEPAQAILPSGQLLYANEAWRSLLQYSEAELSSLRFVDLLPSSEQERILRLCQTVLQDRAALPLRTTLIAQNGDWLRVAGRITPLQSDANNVELWMVWRLLLRVPAAELPEPQILTRLPLVLADPSMSLDGHSPSRLLRLIMDHIPQAVFWKNHELRYLGCNQRFAIDAGVSFPHEVLGKTDYDMPWGHTEAGWIQSWDTQVLNTGEPVLGLLETQVRSGGTLAWLKVNKIPLYNPSGQVIGVLGTYEDITERKGAQEELQLKQNQLEALLDNIPHLAWLKDRDGHLIDVNEPFALTFGQPRDVLIGKTDYDFADPVLAQKYRTDDLQVMTLKQRQCFEEQIINAQGESRWIETIKTPIVDGEGRVTGTVGIALDITERKRAEQELETYRHQLEAQVVARTADLEREIGERRQIELQLYQEKELAQVTLQAIADGVITTDRDGRIEYLNPMAEKLTRWSLSLAKGRPIADIFVILDETTRVPQVQVLQHSLTHSVPAHFTNKLMLVAKDGVEYDVDVSTAPIHDREGNTIGLVLVFRDVTHSRLISREVTWQATHDALTGLFNRFHFEEVVVEAIQNIALEGQRSILCYLDLDQFKVVNDTCGHLAGDELLRHVADMLRQQIRSADVVARLGGDEFGILLTPCTVEQARAIADKLREQIHEFQFFWEQKSFRIGVSIGLVALTEADQTFDSIMSAADAACYAAKDGGRNRIHLYQANDVEVARQRRERQWSVRIQQSLADNRFCLYRQLIVPAREVGGRSQPCYELLIRMIDDDGKLVPPGVFIPSAERYSLMSELDRWVVKTFLDWPGPSYRVRSSKTSSQPQPEMYMINLSGVSLSDAKFLGWLVEQLSHHTERAKQICFEITETAAITNFGQAMQFIKTVKTFGCLLALDDFGSGMSSFAYLKNLPVDFLKIDGKFVEDMHDDPTAQAIVEAINSVGHVMGIKTIAEYVNTPELRKRLWEIGVDYVQGFGIAQPEPFIPAMLDHLRAIAT